ncbi:helix-turn-helix transcriptional regulator [Syntrophaceticus schinkii]|uniref:helix-turn-helix transcriptional regulator n=1 Tax=Syntrophaceticus schinkii TaxID=499207 RepID=UPI0005CC01E4|nr:helix-turn-helix transcriptional regulator [Syntrophaceticus schinkii]MDD4675530.1 helix-turn-helix transcriptional regulator [Syntrophaceticus schinkii]
MRLTPRQEQIIEIVKENTPITGEKIANKLNVRRATLRPDLAVLTMAGLLEARPRVGYFYSGKTPYMLIAEEIRHLKVMEVKSVPVVVTEDASVYDAIVALFTEDVGTLFIVTNDSCLVGAVSRKDLLKVALGQGDLHKIPVQVVMTRLANIITVSGEESVYDAASKLVVHEVDALPVVEVISEDSDREMLKVIGRFTKTTVVRIFVEMGEGR